jgi:hypothetical protein
MLSAQSPEPGSLIQMRLERETKARSGLAPHAVVVARGHPECVGARGKPGVERRTAIARIDPVRVEALELISKVRALRNQETQSCVVELPLLRTGRDFDAVRERNRRVVDRHSLDVHRRRQPVGRNVSGIDAHDAAHARKPE